MEENQQQSCTDWEEKLAALQPAALINDKAFQSHLQHCPQCAFRWYCYNQMRHFVFSQPMKEPVPPFPSRLHEIWDQEERARTGVDSVIPHGDRKEVKKKRRKNNLVSSYYSLFTYLKKRSLHR